VSCSFCILQEERLGITFVRYGTLFIKVMCIGIFGVCVKRRIFGTPFDVITEKISSPL
jgi:hypothetical protein